MERGKQLARALSGVLVGGILLSGSMAFAGDTNNTIVKSLAENVPSIGQKMTHLSPMAMNHHSKADRQKVFQSTLDQLVRDGVITPAKAVEIRAFMEKRAKERQARLEQFKKLTPEQRKALKAKRKTENPGTRSGGKSGLINELVKANILSQEQADIFKTKLRENVNAQEQQRISDGLKGLVEKGTITQEQSDKIEKQFEEARKARRPLSQLVADGVITQEQAQAIVEILHR